MVRRGSDSFEENSRTYGHTNRNLFLQEDGERATVRFLVDLEDFVHGFFHRPFASGRAVVEPTVCTSWQLAEGLIEEPVPCGWCERKDRPRQTFFTWVYVRGIFHVKQSQGREPWTRVKVGNLVLFQQQVAARRLFVGGQQLFNVLKGLHQEYQTLTDRDYIYVRSGARGAQNVSYSFIPRHESLFQYEEAIPDLAEAVLGVPPAPYGGYSTIDDSYTPDSEEFEAPADEELPFL